MAYGAEFIQVGVAIWWQSVDVKVLIESKSNGSRFELPKTVSGFDWRYVLTRM